MRVAVVEFVADIQADVDKDFSAHGEPGSNPLIQPGK